MRRSAMSKGRWVRKWSRDAGTDGFSPLPTQVVSNEEYIPLAQTEEQKRVAALIDGHARRSARRLGVGRREFLATSAGMAAAFLALNTVFGSFFEIDPVEAIESAAADERKPSGQFIFDIQTHHVAEPRQFPFLLGLRRAGRNWNPDLAKDRGTMEDIYLGNYIKEIFLDSDTTVAVISGIPSATDTDNILPPDKMAETRDVINRLGASQRLVAHGLITPNKGPGDLDEMRRQAADLKIGAWKGYTGLPFGNPPKPWRVDDEKVSYPMLEASRRLGIKNICLHKGLPLQNGVEEYWHPRDLERAAKDFSRPIARRRSRALGHRLHLVGLPSLADRGASTIHDARVAHEAVRVPSAHAGREGTDLRPQRRPRLRNRSERASQPGTPRLRVEAESGLLGRRADAEPHPVRMGARELRGEV